MYIAEFWVGVGATILCEICALIAYIMYENRKVK